MKFFSKKPGKAESLGQQAAAFAERRAAAEKLDDPADRLAAMLPLGRDMVYCLVPEEKILKSDPFREWRWWSVATSVNVFASLAIMILMPPVALLGLANVAGGLVMSMRMQDADDKERRILKGIEESKISLFKEIHSLMRDHSAGIAAAGKSDRVFHALPEVRETFNYYQSTAIRKAGAKLLKEPLPPTFKQGLLT